MLSNETVQNTSLLRPMSKRSTRVPFVVPVKDSLSTSTWLNSQSKSSFNRLLSAKSDKSKSLTIMRPESIKRANNDACMAAAIGDLEWLKQSLRMSNEMAFDKNGLSTIHLASIHCRMNILKYLIEERNVDSNYPSANGWRPIHLVISAKNGKDAVECLNYLIERGAEINVKNEDLVTPLHQAASEGHYECLKILLEHNADPFILDYRNQMPLDLAKLWGHKKCAKQLAASMWHTEKVLSFKQDYLDKRLRTQDVLLEIERAHTILHDEKKKSATKHFDSWLNQQSFIKTNSKTTSAKTEVQSEPATTKKPAINNKKKLPTFNYDSYDSDTAEKKGAPKIRIDDKAANAKLQTQRSMLSSATHDSDMMYSSQDLNYNDNNNAATAARRPTIQTDVTEPLSKWDYSTKVEGKDYVKNLDDFYPRDPYTKMPSDPDLLLLHHQLHGLSLDEVKEFMKKNLEERAKQLRKQKEKIEKTKSKNKTSTRGKKKELKHSASTVASYKSDRPVYYKPKHVLDYESKAKVCDEFTKVDNTALTLFEDPKSFFYQETKKIVEKQPPPSEATRRVARPSRTPVVDNNEFKNTIEFYYNNDLYEFMKTKNGKVNPKYEKVFIC